MMGGVRAIPEMLCMIGNQQKTQGSTIQCRKHGHGMKLHFWIWDEKVAALHVTQTDIRRMYKQQQKIKHCGVRCGRAIIEDISHNHTLTKLFSM